MARTKKKILPITTLEKIIDIHAEMRDLAVIAGIQEIKYIFAVKNLDKQSEEYQLILLDWLERFKNIEYKNAFTLWKKMSSHGWENLKKLLDVHDLPEQILLNSKFKLLREAWANRPRPAKKK